MMEDRYFPCFISRPLSWYDTEDLIEEIESHGYTVDKEEDPDVHN